MAPQVQDQNAFMASLVQELQQVTQSGGSHQLSISPELFDSIDTTNNPGAQHAQSLYRAMFMLQHSEGGRRSEDITSVLTTLGNMMNTDAPATIPQLQYLYETLRQLLPTGNEDSEGLFKQDNTAQSPKPTNDEDPVLKATALLPRIAKGALSSKPEEIEQAIKDCGEVIEIFDRNHITGGRAHAYMLRGAAYTELAARNPNKQPLIEQALADLEEALTFFTQEKAPDDWAEILLNRSILYHMYKSGDLVQNNKKALEDSLAALSILSYAKSPFRWAAAHKSCGNAYAFLFTMKRSKDVMDAQKHYNEALKVFTAENAPSAWAETLIARAILTRATALSSETRELRPNFFNQGDMFDTLERMSQNVEDAIADFYACAQCHYQTE